MDTKTNTHFIIMSVQWDWSANIFDPKFAYGNQSERFTSDSGQAKVSMAVAKVDNKFYLTIKNRRII